MTVITLTCARFKQNAMIIALILTFIIGYTMIVFEHPLHMDKAVPALLMGAITWSLISVGGLDVMGEGGELGTLEPVMLHTVGKIAEILLFLLGAMVIVEFVDMHRGFYVITSRITTTNKTTMLWILLVLSFFMSAALDNMATTIVLVSLLRKLIPQREERLHYISMAVIGANAGGAWSPIGDVTTTMLWIGKKVSTAGLIEHLVLPSFVCVAIPGLIGSFLPQFRGKISPAAGAGGSAYEEEKPLPTSSLMLFLGLGGLLFVPIFKGITHLPPYMGIMIALGTIWLVSEFYLHRSNEDDQVKYHKSIRYALTRVEMTSILFFLGILSAVGALENVAVLNAAGEHTGLLSLIAEKLSLAIPSDNIVVILIGIASAVIDNVPLVAATMGMYEYPIDSELWHFIAFSAGTGGSMLIIGSAAGVAAMGMERINFIWYLKNMSWLAALGFLGGCAAFIIEKYIETHYLM